MDKIGEFPDHTILGKFMDSKDFYNLSEVSKYWIKVQELMNSNKKITFLKTHSSLCNINGNKFTNSANTLAFIHIVRDPRNIVLSMANHFGITQEESYKIISDKMYIIYPKKNNQPIPSTLVSSWNNHYLSWKNINIPKIILRYEDLIDDPYNNFLKILEFINQFKKIDIDENKINDVIKKCAFKQVSDNEKKFGFVEKKGKENFFRKGLVDEWKVVLKKDLIQKIEKEFYKEMRELKYI